MSHEILFALRIGNFLNPFIKVTEFTLRIYFRNVVNKHFHKTIVVHEFLRNLSFINDFF